MPPMKLPVTTLSRPSSISPMPKPLPAPEAMRVAWRRSPRQYHRAARSTRPPSMGKAGIRLKPPSSRLMKAR